MWRGVPNQEVASRQNPAEQMFLSLMLANSGVHRRHFPLLWNGPKPSDINFSVWSQTNAKELRITEGSHVLLGITEMVLFKERSEDAIFISIQNGNIQASTQHLVL